jgi:hypothetical protein
MAVLRSRVLDIRFRAPGRGSERGRSPRGDRASGIEAIGVLGHRPFVARGAIVMA